MKPYEIAERIQQLETFYADRLANHAHYKELNATWQEIQSLRKLLLCIEIFETACVSPAIISS